MDGDRFRDINEVIMIVGPNYDISMKVIDEDEDEDGHDKFVEERVIPHVDRSSICKENVVRVSVPVEERDRKFIMDSGSGHDLISKRKAERMGLDTVTCDPVTFHTAIGITVAQHEVEIDLGTIKSKVNAHVLDDTPSVFSMGMRCTQDGYYSFVWPARGEPFMIDQKGMRINMIVRDLIPYIHLGLPRMRTTHL